MGITNGTKGAKASDLAGVLFNALGSSRGWHGRHIGRKQVFTAAHVALGLQAHRPATELFVRFHDGRVAPARLDAIVPDFDAAVLRIESMSNPPPALPIARSAAVTAGEGVLIAGRPASSGGSRRAGRYASAVRNTMPATPRA